MFLFEIHNQAEAQNQQAKSGLKPETWLGDKQTDADAGSGMAVTGASMP